MAEKDRLGWRTFLIILRQIVLPRRKSRLVTRGWRETRGPDTCHGHAARLKG
jgi:hypothetical protein